MPATLKVGLVQQAAWPDKARSLAESEAGIRALAAQGATLVLLQELHATHYFCQTEDDTLFDLAEPLDGPSAQRLAALAAELDIVLVGSLFERRAAGLYHNTAVVFDRQQGRVGYYRKMHIPDDPGFYEKFYFTPGDAEADAGFEPIDTSVGRLGLLVCWDQWYPEAARLMALAGADLLLYPTAIGWTPTDAPEEKQRQKDAWTLIQRSHGVANGLPVLVANRVGHEPDPSGASPGIDFWGGSFVCGPQGELLAQADDAPAHLLVDVDLSRSEQVRRVWPYLRDRRIDAYDELTKRYRDR
ncbi:carbon-nitrogen hydrolase [Chromohalobacter israelensis]|uniref:Nitrilase/cyanide hydratase and apolipoprotein N-acyltransferase n=1 Tax=Chromohalobacter israelensis (strain ATCC BAA-138 / DSM 3043 / CIP 106854 / NCIMB 13768 / 1H11) TaxID=290398 RepID=Q1QX75_CHRI1|nr:carbon-nitrogen hydrolase [Chromohalobacter salexigens]ABE58933.1 Nitrilase/cyanide hydratase and apolipoprotein N-acyltransferase [Chromohalobacter salexigens DSM 3043]NWO54641.1 acyltransferase [Chromohalobacter salexigens]RXE48047.1 acyltransferase [Chromohalobacter salexigens]